MQETDNEESIKKKMAKRLSINYSIQDLEKDLNKKGIHLSKSEKLDLYTERSIRLDGET